MLLTPLILPFEDSLAHHTGVMVVHIKDSLLTSFPVFMGAVSAMTVSFPHSFNFSKKRAA
jgi:hypothetical protein